MSTAATATPRRAASELTTALSALRLLTMHAMRRDTRMLDALLVSIALPVLIMATFVFVFGGAIDTSASGPAYVDFVVPAVIVMCAGYGAATTAAAIAKDLTGGMIDRFRTLPVTDWAVPVSHVAASLGRNLATTATALAAALVMGFRPDATTSAWCSSRRSWAATSSPVSALAVVWGLLVRSVQAAGAFSFVVLFGPYISDAFVPVQTMPAGLRTFAEHQPTTPLVQRCARPCSTSRRGTPAG